ncbi:MAG: hypothetical protein EOP24_39210 [Hyphomicrobiales bacterium]|nr:MAG: hypothetical protein EOP24_39210 [Hyphomicrobiales bacterium]
MNEAELYESAKDALEECIGELYHQAVEVSDAYLAFVDGVEKKAKGWQERSSLQLSCTRKGNHLDLRWTGLKWFGKTSERSSLRITIARNTATQGYTFDKLKVFAKEWEIDEVMKAEEKLQVIRRKSQHLVKAIISVRNAIKVLKANDTEESDVDTDAESLPSA